MLQPPETSFASDNTAGVAPAVMAAMVEANQGHAIAYGSDVVTERFRAKMRGVFGERSSVLLAWGGTGANIVALSTLVRPHQGIISPSTAHINVDECGAVERFLGSKIIDVETSDGKLRPEHVEAQLSVLGDVHHTQPGAISITQITEYGTVYSLEELTSVCGAATAAGLRIHMDGARIANAAAALDVSLRELTVDLGVDVLSLGGTKNGAAYGEAVVFFDPDLAELGRFNQKQAAQLPSKMRFVAAQFDALFTDELWLQHGRHANAMAQRLVSGMAEVPGVQVTQEVRANAVFARLPRSVVTELQEWSHFYVWAEGLSGPEPIDEVRWMTSFETTAECVDRFVAGVASAMAGN